MITAIVLINALSTFCLGWYLFESSLSKRRVDKMIFIEFSRLINEQKNNLDFMKRIKNQGDLNKVMQDELKSNIAFAKSTITNFTTIVKKIKSDSY